MEHKLDCCTTLPGVVMKFTICWSLPLEMNVDFHSPLPSARAIEISVSEIIRRIPLRKVKGLNVILSYGLSYLMVCLVR